MKTVRKNHQNRSGQAKPAGRFTASAALCAITLVGYANSFGLGFALDSQTIIENDTRIQKATAGNLRLIASKDYWWPKAMDRLYRPVTTASFLFNYAILGNGKDAAGYHWVNFLLHLAGVLLLYRLGLRLFGRTGPAFLAAALWAVHPIGTETVANIAGRADLLATVAILAGLLFYIHLAESEGPITARNAAALFLIAAAAAFSKETGATLLSLMLLWDLVFPTGDWRAVARRRLPAYLAAAAAVGLLLFMRWSVLASVPWSRIPFLDNPMIGAGFWTAKLTAIKVIGMELWLLVYPMGLSFDRSFDQIVLDGWTDVRAWLAMAAVAGILAAVVVRRRKDPLLFWAAGFFGLTLLPASNLLFTIGSIMAERLLYLPSIGFVVAAAALVFRLRKPRAAYAVLGAAIALCAARTLARNPVWADDVTLAESGIASAPRSFRTHELLARGLFRQDRQRNIDRAISEAEIAWSIIRPLPPERSFYETPAYLGMYYQVKGEAVGGLSTPAGRAWYEKALPMLQTAAGLAKTAETAFDVAQRAHGKPPAGRLTNADLYLNLGSANAALGSFDEAIQAFRYAKGINPSDPQAYDGLSAVYLVQGNVQGAAVVLEEKTQVDGLKPATMNALVQLYAKLPGGSCAVVQQGPELKLDLGCPKARTDLCAAWADLAQSFVESRQIEGARLLKERSINKYKCPEDSFAKVP